MWCTKYVFCYTELFRHGSPACQTGGQNYNSISKVSLCELKWRATVITMIHRKTILPGNPFKPADCLCVTGTPSSFKPTMYNESPPCTMTAHHVQCLSHHKSMLHCWTSWLWVTVIFRRPPIHSLLQFQFHFTIWYTVKCVDMDFLPVQILATSTCQFSSRQVTQAGLYARNFTLDAGHLL